MLNGKNVNHINHNKNTSNLSEFSAKSNKKEVVDKTKKLSFILDDFYVLKKELENRERIRTTSNLSSSNIFNDKLINNKKYNLGSLIKNESKTGLSRFEINGLKDFRLKYLSKNDLEIKDIANYMRYMVASQVNRNFTKIERTLNNEKKENLIVKPAQYIDLIKQIKYLLLDLKIPKYYSKLTTCIFKQLTLNKFYSNQKNDNKRVTNKIQSFKSNKSIKTLKTKFKNSDTNLSSLNSTKTQLPEIKQVKNIYKSKLNVVEEENINLNVTETKEKNENSFFLTTISNKDKNSSNHLFNNGNLNLKHFKKIQSNNNLPVDSNLITRNVLDKSKNDVFISNNSSFSTIKEKNKSTEKSKKGDLFSKNKKWKIPFDFELESETKNLIPNYLITEPNFKNKLLTNSEICNEVKRIFPKSKINENVLTKNLNKNNNSIFGKTFVLSDGGYKNKKDNRSMSDKKSEKSIGDIIFNNEKCSKNDFYKKCNSIIENNNVIETVINEEKSYDNASLIPKKEFIEKDINGLNVDYLIKNKELNHDKIPINKINHEVIISKRKAEMIRIVEALNKLDYNNFSKLLNTALKKYDSLATELVIEGYEKPPNYLETKINSNKNLGKIGNMHLKMKRILVDYTKTYKNNL